MIEDYFTQTITRRRYTTDINGRESIVPDDLQVTCRLENTNTLVIDSTGESQRVDMKIFCSVGIDIMEGDRIVVGLIGTGEDPSGFPVLYVDTENGFDDSHMEISVGRGAGRPG